MRTKTDILGVGIHDLRHSFASLLVFGNASLKIIGRLLGYTQISKIQRYAHLIDSPLQSWGNAAGNMLKPRLKLVAW